MRIEAILRWFFIVLLVAGYSASNGQHGFRFPVGESVATSARTIALNEREDCVVEKPITSAMYCASWVASAINDAFRAPEGPSTLGAGIGWYLSAAQSTAVVKASGNSARIDIQAIGGTSVEVSSWVYNLPPSCLFALQVGSSEATHDSQFALPFIVPLCGRETSERNPVLLVLNWGHAVGRSRSATGDCGGLWAEPWFSESTPASFFVGIYDSSGNLVFADTLSTSEPGERHVVRNLHLAPGRYIIVGSDSSGTTGTAGAIVNHHPPRCATCGMNGSAGSGTGLSVTLIACRRVIAIPVEAIRADIDGSYSVDDGDLLTVINQYGDVNPTTLADINGDGMVDDGDLLMVLQWYGTEY
jgi:hypothetical protein